MMTTDDVLVVGGGPAGAACALWAHQLGLRVRLLEAGDRIGGLQLRSPYENRWLPGLPGLTGQEIAASLQTHLDIAQVPYEVGFGAAFLRRGPSAGGWEVSNGQASYRAPHVVIATGSRPRRAGFVESETVGIGPGTSMERIDVRGKRVAMLGGGDNAFDQAAFALRRGARSVDIHCRRPPRAQPLLQRAIPADRVHVGAFVVDTARMTVDGKAYDVIGVQYGFEASLPAGCALPLREGYVDVDRRGAVHGHAGLYAAGEVTNYWHPCVSTSCAQGVQVAKSIQSAQARARRSMAPSSDMALEGLS